MANIFVAATATFNGKALTKGKKEISAFDKQVNKLGKTFAGVFGAQKLLQFSKNAVNAFMADEKAAKSLEQQLKNTGYQFSAPGVEKYIANLQAATGVLDDELRPAFQQLLTVTGSITKSQDALATALNVSAATGKSLGEVSAALAKGYAGQTTALSRLGAGISKATLKTGDMDKIMGELNQKFAGQAAARLDTYAGKMGLLTVAVENAKEEIGKGLLDSLALLSKDTSIATASTAMEDFASAISEAIYGVAVLIKKLDGLALTAKTGGLADLLLRLQPGGKGAQALFSGLRSIGSSAKPAQANLEPRSASRIYLQQTRLENKIIKDTNKARADELAKLKAKSEVDKLKDKFDLERIGLAAALNFNISAEDKLRVNALTAIANNNEALAKKYNAELDAAEKARLLAEAMAKAAAAAAAFPAFAMGAVQRGEYSDAYKNISNVPSGGGGGYSPIPTPSFNMGAVQRGEYPITLNVAGSILTDQDLTNTITDTILRINKMGRGTTPAGGLSGGT